MIADISLIAGLSFSALTAWLVWQDHSAQAATPTNRIGLSAMVRPDGAQVRYSATY
jgi:hypothetical protein